MIKIDGKEYRNLEEQVRKNQQDIMYLESASNTLNQFGISVKDVVETTSQIPSYSNPDAYQGVTGDAYAVGTTQPYDMYVYTALESGQTDYIWLNLGAFPKEGPQGVTGATGPQGPAGVSRLIQITNTAPTTYNGAALVNGDLYMNTNGVVYQYGASGWTQKTSLKGPAGSQGIQGIQGPQGLQGPQGIQGVQGDTGTIIHITAKWPYNVSQLEDHPLPSPEVINDSSVAYLVPEAADESIYDIFLQVGDSRYTRVWTNVGPVAGGTDVMVNDTYAPTFNADSKLNVKSVATDYDEVYGKTAAGAQYMYPLAMYSLGYSIPVRSSTGTLCVATPVNGTDAVNKTYVDTIVGDIEAALEEI